MNAYTPTEAEEARVLMQYMKLRNIRFTHVKNETGRSAGGEKVANWRAVWAAQDGVSKGFPDFIIALPHVVIAIELKRVKGSRVSPEQQAWIDDLNAGGLPSYVAKGADQAIKIIEQHYKVTRPTLAMIRGEF